ncbi:MAG: ribulose 1,5-bisphosphate carboxylase, partial [Thermoanaerobaculia bacterium]
MSALLRARYRLALAPGEDAELRARQLAREQTVEIPEGVAPAAVEARALGRVEDVEPLGGGRFLAAVAFPLAATGSELTQLVNVLWGNVSLWSGVRLESVAWPAELLARFSGPAFGAGGLRDLAGAAPGRPL